MDRADLDRLGEPVHGAALTVTSDGSAVTADGPAPSARPAPGAARPGGVRARARHPVLTHLAVLAGFIAAGVAATWPRASYLAGRLPASRDSGSYVWGFWWMTHQVEHLGNPWFTRAIAAPTGTQLGLHALMPLPDLLMMPVTIIFGPSAAYNLLSIAIPGLLCYVTYRVARLWLPSQAGAIAAGAFFGLSSMLTWRSWYHLNLAAGVLFIPLALEAAVRLRRRPGWRQALVLGLVVGGALLTDQEMAVLALILTGLALAPWLLRHPSAGKLGAAALAGLIAGLVASPQIIAVIQQTKAGGATSPPGPLATSYVKSGVSPLEMFALSPRVSDLGLGSLSSHGISYNGPIGDGIPVFGVVLTVLAVVGLIVMWRQRSARLLALLWLGCIALALGAVLKIGPHIYIPAAQEFDGQRVSRVLPYTWFVRLPVLSGFREASRILMLGILPASLLAGAAVNWLRYHALRAIALVVILGAVEAGWSGNASIGSMPTALPAVDRPIAADHSGSLVVDVPFGIRGGTQFTGSGFDPEAQVLATADGHPRAVAFISRVPTPTVTGITKHAFYARLMAVQEGNQNSSADLAAARLDARRMGIGWVLVWSTGGRTPAVIQYLRQAGFRFDYQADGVRVYRPGRQSG